MKRIKITLAIVVITGALMGGCSHAPWGTGTAGKPPAGVVVEIMYATDRNITEEEDPKRYYGENRGQVSYGRCRMIVRPDKAKSRFADPSLWEADTGKKIKKKAELQSLRTYEKQEFLNEVSRKMNTSPDPSVLVYIHGFGRKFERSARTHGTMVYELSYLGVPILYSWPSKGKASAYPADRTTLEWSTPHFVAFIDNVALHTGAETIHLAAHSLGNQALLKALVHFIDDRPSEVQWKFGEIILMAPDVDRDIFYRDFAPALARAASRVTLYVSAVDVPLTASRKINRYPRVGDAKDGPVIAAGIETVDAREVTNLVTGHSYYRDSPEVMSDLYYLINKRLPANKRPTVQPAESPRGRYWKVVPESRTAQ